MIIGVSTYQNLVQQENVPFDGGQFVGKPVHGILFYDIALVLELNQFLHEVAVEIVRWLSTFSIRSHHNGPLVTPALQDPHIHVDDLVGQPAVRDEAANMLAKQGDFALVGTNRAVEDHPFSDASVMNFVLVTWVNATIHRIPELLYFPSLLFSQRLVIFFALVGDKA